MRLDYLTVLFLCFIMRKDFLSFRLGGRGTRSVYEVGSEKVTGEKRGRLRYVSIDGGSLYFYHAWVVIIPT